MWASPDERMSACVEWGGSPTRWPLQHTHLHWACLQPHGTPRDGSSRHTATGADWSARMGCSSPPTRGGEKRMPRALASVMPPHCSPRCYQWSCAACPQIQHGIGSAECPWRVSQKEPVAWRLARLLGSAAAPRQWYCSWLLHQVVNSLLESPGGSTTCQRWLHRLPCWLLSQRHFPPRQRCRLRRE